MSTPNLPEIRQTLDKLWDDAIPYFEAAQATIPPNSNWTGFERYHVNSFWERLSKEERASANGLIDRLLPVCAAVAEIVRSSVLTGSEDLHDIKVIAKAMRAALRLRRYRYQAAQVINDEDRVLGVQPADQTEEGLAPAQAASEFFEKFRLLDSVLTLAQDGQ